MIFIVLSYDDMKFTRQVADGKFNGIIRAS